MQLLSVRTSKRPTSRSCSTFKPGRWLPLLALLLATLAPSAAKGDSTGDHPLCDAGFLHVVTQDALGVTADQCRAVAKQTMAAWRFDLDQMHWLDSGAMDASLTLRLLSVDRMKTEHAGVIGFARGRDLFVVSTAVLDDPFANGTLAHELAHIQAKRALGKVSEKRLVPRYFIEGHGNALGRLYRDHLGVSKHDYDVRKARQISKMSAAEAKAILTDDTYGASDKKDLDKMEAMGIFFVEYLRVRQGGKGVPDAVARMGRVFEQVGRGAKYGDVFKTQFADTVERVVSQIVSFFERTAARPAERWKGTRYEASS